MLLTSIREIADEPVFLDPHDQEAEFSNTCRLDATAEELSSLSTDNVVSALHWTARALRRRIGETGFQGTATFYVWHDEQAGQLRCSISSRTPADLPFAGDYQPTDGLDAIVAGFLRDAAPGIVAWEELEPADGADSDGLPHSPFLVWTFALTPGEQ